MRMLKKFFETKAKAACFGLWFGLLLLPPPLENQLGQKMSFVTKCIVHFIRYLSNKRPGPFFITIPCAFLHRCPVQPIMK